MKRNRKTTARVEMGQLEARVLMHGALDMDDCCPALAADRAPAAEHASVLQQVKNPRRAQRALLLAAASTEVGEVAYAALPTSGVPALSSLPGAPANLYLDFDGDYTATWGRYSPGTTPAYDVDGNPSAFSSTELANIRQIWSHVAEKYSPFNINVTTVDPGNLTDRVTLKVVIGGTGSWAGGAGISYIGSFYNGIPNIAFVHSAAVLGRPLTVAQVAVHEAGHAFGLRHQSVYSGTTLVTEYNSGSNGKAPIMGGGTNTTRDLWWYGPCSSGYNVIQDDLATLSSVANGFGYRADDHGNTAAAATALTVANGSFSASGVITVNSDKDWFSFTTTGGTANIAVNVAQYGAMLDAKLEVRNSAGTVVASANTASLNESLSVSLAAGTYYVVVASAGGYGDIGQYALTGTIGSQTIAQPPTATNPPATDPTPTTPTPTTPTTGLLTATALDGRTIRLSWGTVTSSIRIEKLTSSGAWTTIANLSSSARTFLDTNCQPGTQYSYRLTSGTTVAQTTGTTWRMGDVNGDGVVNASDLNILKRYYGTTGRGIWLTGDLDGDGNVGIRDFLLLSQNYTS